MGSGNGLNSRDITASCCSLPVVFSDDIYWRSTRVTLTLDILVFVLATRAEDVVTVIVYHRWVFF